MEEAALEVGTSSESSSSSTVSEPEGAWIKPGTRSAHLVRVSVRADSVGSRARPDKPEAVQLTWCGCLFWPAL